MIVIGGDQEISRATHDEYMGIAVALRIPMIFVVSKTDVLAPLNVLR